MDSVRGPSKENLLNQAAAEVTDAANGLQSFDSNGFTLGSEAGRMEQGTNTLLGVGTLVVQPKLLLLVLLITTHTTNLRCGATT